MTLASDYYYAEDSDNDDDEDSDFDDDSEDPESHSDWKSKSVWHNYHTCSLGYDHGCFKLCTQEQYNPDFLDGLEIELDTPTEAGDDSAFSIYLLGHDSVGFHRLRFERLADSNKFKILWSGKIALTYAGQNEFKYDFRAVIGSAEFPQLEEG